jgi:hypothetical protein
MKSIITVKVFTDDAMSIWRDSEHQATIETTGTLRTLSQTSYAIGEAAANAIASLCYEIEETAKQAEATNELDA